MYLSFSVRIVNQNHLISDKMDNFTEKSVKKPHDKKAYRKKKYDQKTKVDLWKSKREKYIKHQYNKIQKKETSNFDVKKIYEEESVLDGDVDKRGMIVR